MTSNLMTRQIQVDSFGGVKTFNTLESAMAFAATVPRSSSSEFVQVKLNIGVTPITTLPLTIPPWVILSGDGSSGESNVPCSCIFLAPNADDTVGIVASENTQINNVAIINTFPANFDTEFTLLRIDGTAKVRECLITTAGINYDGANPMTMVKSDDGSVDMYDSIIFCDGDGAVSAEVNTSTLMKGCSLLGEPSKFIEIDASIPATLQHCRLGLNDFTSNVPVYINANLNSTVNLWGTRIPLDKRTGTGEFVEIHPTPQQLSTSLTAKNRTVSDTDTLADRTIDAYADGCLEVDSSTAVVTVFAPVYADAINGQEFKFKRVGGNNVTVDGGGVNIDGVGTFILTANYETVTISKNDRGTWSAY